MTIENRQIQLAGHNSVGFGEDEWNPLVVLLKNQIGIEINTRRIKIGDGELPWSELPYVVFDSGTYTTDDIPEGTGNKFFTSARAIASTLSGLVTTAGNVTSQDSILTAIGKLVGLTSSISSDLQEKLDVTDFVGYSASLLQNVNFTDANEAVLALLDFSYLAATISLAATPAQTIREKGAVVTNIALSAITAKRSNPITSVTFRKGASLLNTVSAPNPNGGTSTFTDATGISDNTSYTATVSDGTTTVTSSPVNYTFVYPYFSGVGAANLNGAAISALTKSVIASTASRTVTFTLANQKMYFAYPSEYPALTSILVAGFESITGFTVRTVNITGLNSIVQSYRVYESNDLLTGTATVTFIQ